MVRREESVDHQPWHSLYGSASNHFFNYRFRWKFSPTPYRNCCCCCSVCRCLCVRVFYITTVLIETDTVQKGWAAIYSLEQSVREYCVLRVCVCWQIKKVTVIQFWNTLKKQRQCCVYSSYSRWYSIAIVRYFDNENEISFVLFSRCWIRGVTKAFRFPRTISNCHK